MQRTRRMGLQAASLAAALTMASTALAGHPELARYSDAADRTFWFVMVTDTHIDDTSILFPADEVGHLRFVVGEAFDTIVPWFVVITGDVTDHTEGIAAYLTTDNTAEWLLYRNIVDAAGMDETILFDIPGNHDFYGNAGGFYLDNSVQGQAQGTTQPDWVLDLPFGKYHFVSVATPHNDSSPQPWPFDNVAFSAAEVDEVEYNLLSNTDANLTIVFGHHDLEAASGADAMRAVLADYGAVFYGHGHEHSLGYRTGSGIIRYRLNSMGQGNTENLSVWAVDNDALSISQVDVTSPWPLAVITAPADAALGDIDNPYAPTVPQTCTEAPVRVLAFDAAGITEIYFTVDDGGLHPLTENPVMPSQYLGSFDATDFTAGVHTIEVQVEGSAGWRQFSSQFVLEDGECDIEPTPVDEDPEPVAEEVEPAPEVEEPVPEIPDADTDPAVDVSVDTASDEEQDTQDWSGEGGSVVSCGCTIVR